MFSSNMRYIKNTKIKFKKTIRLNYRALSKEISSINSMSLTKIVLKMKRFEIEYTR